PRLRAARLSDTMRVRVTHRLPTGERASRRWRSSPRCQRKRKVGDESKLRTWQAEMKKVFPNVQPGDQVVIFCSDTNRTIAYLNDSSTGKVEDASFCPAVMIVLLHTQTKHRKMRKSLLGKCIE